MTLLWLAILILTVLGKRCQTKPLKQSSAYC